MFQPAAQFGKLDGVHAAHGPHSPHTYVGCEEMYIKFT